MTLRLPRGTVRLVGIVRLFLVGICLLALSGQALAARIAVVLSEDSAPYQEAYQAIRSQLDPTPHGFYPVYADTVSVSILGGANLVVTIGVRAAESVAALPIRTPVLAAMVPRTWYLRTGRALLADSGRRDFSAIYVDQPFERQAALIRQALPDAARVGVLLGADQAGLLPDLSAALQANRLDLVSAVLPDEGRLLPALEGLLPETDLLLAVADPQVFNRSTAQSLFLTTYRYRKPVVGYSRSMTRAGALLSLHASPAQIGRQAAETAVAGLQGAAVRLPAPAFPAYFSISINDKVGRSLGYTLPTEAELEKRMGARP
ncbi:MAG: ABC transporter substrate-binding protein [Gammaproteobacteria bacterium]